MRRWLIGLALLLCAVGARAQSGGGGVSTLPFNITNPSNDECLILTGPPWVIINGSCSGSSSTNWSAIVSGTNTQAAMLVGTGASLGYSGSGVVDANEIAGLAFPSLVSGDCLTNNGSALSWGTCGSGGGVSSFSGDGSLLDNSASTGAVTATLSNTGVGYGVWGNTGSSSGAPGYHALSAYPAAAFPTLNQATTGNAATATALASAPTTCTSGEAAQGILANGNATGCFTPSGSGTVDSGTSGQLAYYAASGTAVSGETTVTAAQLGASSAVLADIQANTAFTIAGTGCTPTVNSDAGPFSGYFTLAATCTAVTITLNGATGFSAPHGYVCDAFDQTLQAAGTWFGDWGNESSTTTTVTFQIPPAAGTTDVIGFRCTYQ